MPHRKPYIFLIFLSALSLSLLVTFTGCAQLLQNAPPGVPWFATQWGYVNYYSNVENCQIWLLGTSEGNKFIGYTPIQGASLWYVSPGVFFQVMARAPDGRTQTQAVQVPPIPPSISFYFEPLTTQTPSVEQPASSASTATPVISPPKWETKDIIELPSQANWLGKFVPLQVVIKTIEKSVITIKTPVGHGSGFIVHSGGLAITSYHVVKDASTIKVQLFDGTEIEASLVRADPVGDVALLRLKDGNYPVASLGNTTGLETGMEVYAVGAPLDPVLSNSVSKGIVSAIRLTTAGYKDIQTDVAVNPGNSGGPLIDRAGRVIGIVAWKVSGGVQGVAFAVSIDDAKRGLGLR